MTPSEEKNSKSADQEKNYQALQTNSENKSEIKPTMSKREIMEELSRQRFPWEE